MTPVGDVGGEACASAMSALTSTISDSPVSIDAAIAAPPWYAIWTRAQCEQLVHDQLASRGFDVFLPKHLAWTGRAPRRRRLEQPLFAGYLFVRDPIDK